LLTLVVMITVMPLHRSASDPSATLAQAKKKMSCAQCIKNGVTGRNATGKTFTESEARWWCTNKGYCP
jgi:hypothetical protein